MIIPAYNVAQYIAATLDSVFAQTFRDFEVVLVNDGSPDTLALKRALEPYLNQIVYFEQANSGPSTARNNAILRAQGEYVALLDSDDAWLPNFLSEQLRLFENDPDLRLVYCNSELFGDPACEGQLVMQTAPSVGDADFENLLRMRCTVQTSTVVAHRQTLIDAGLFDSQFSYSEDFDLWLRVARAGNKIGYQETVLARHRLHTASLSANVARMYQGQVDVYRKTANTLPLSETERAIIESQIRICTGQMHLEQGKKSLLDGDYKDARRHLQQALAYTPSTKIRAALLALRFAPSALRHYQSANRKGNNQLGRAT